MERTLIDLRPRLNEPAVQNLLALAMGMPTPAKIQSVCHSYRADAQRLILGLAAGGCVIGCIGLDTAHEKELVILHLAVDPACRRRGLGRWMIQQASRRSASPSLLAETDGEAVEFYRRCGFSIGSLGKNKWGVERFQCRLQDNIDT